MKSSTVNPDHNPGIREQDIGLLKSFYIFKPVVHGLASRSILRSKRVKQTNIDISTLNSPWCSMEGSPLDAPDEC